MAKGISSFRTFYESEGNPAILVHETDAEFATNIANGQKTIETRGVPLPARLKGMPLELVTNIGDTRYSLGKVTFSESIPYNPDQDMDRWEGDRDKHMVPAGNEYNLGQALTRRGEKQVKHGWVVSNMERYPKPVPFDGRFVPTGLRYPPRV
jgi:hypothetical protein